MACRRPLRDRAEQAGVYAEKADIHVDRFDACLQQYWHIGAESRAIAPGEEREVSVTTTEEMTSSRPRR